MFSFDPVGSYEREIYRASGSASSLLQPLLDNQVGFIFYHVHFKSCFFCKPTDDLHYRLISDPAKSERKKRNSGKEPFKSSKILKFGGKML